MSVSVIIPIYNAAQYLPDLIEALNKNAFSPEDEVLLIDNGSTDTSYDICQSYVLKNPSRYRLLSFSEKAGSYATRNYGVNNAKGDTLVFTDSDTKPSSRWISVIKENIENNVVIAGRIQLEIVNNGVWEHFDNIAHLNSEKNAGTNRVATANMAVRKTDFFRVGPFEERFSGGDYGWSIRAHDAGLQIRFLGDAVVTHPTRKTFAQILKKEQRIAFGEGNHYKIIGKSIIVLFVKYLLKFFKISTNIRYHNALIKAGVSRRDLHEFDSKFWTIRYEQLKYALKGYKLENPRNLDVK